MRNRDVSLSNHEFDTKKRRISSLKTGANGGNAYLRDELSPALLKNGWSVGGGFFAKEHHDWVGTTDMDTWEPCFEDLIVEQVRHFYCFGSILAYSGELLPCC